MGDPPELPLASFGPPAPTLCIGAGGERERGFN